MHCEEVKQTWQTVNKCRIWGKGIFMMLYFPPSNFYLKKVRGKQEKQFFEKVAYERVELSNPIDEYMAVNSPEETGLP